MSFPSSPVRNIVTLLDRLSESYIRSLSCIKVVRDGSYKLMTLNRNKKVVFVDLKKYDPTVDHPKYTLLSCLLPDDLFILAIFDEQNRILPLSTLGSVNLSLKEVYFYSKELHDLDWIYEGDFRKKDSFYKIHLENAIN